MSNIEQFASTQLTEDNQFLAANSNFVPTNYNGISDQEIDPTTLSSNNVGPVNVAAGVQGNDLIDQAGSVPSPLNNENSDNANPDLQQFAKDYDVMNDPNQLYQDAQAQQHVAPPRESEVTDLMNADAQEARTIEADQSHHGGEGPGSGDAPPRGPENDQGPTGPGFDNGMEGGTPSAPGIIQTGGDGYRLGVDAEMVGGQPVVEGYDSEQAVCSDNQVGGGSPFNFITDPDTNASLSIFSDAGKALLKRYVKAYKQMQSGGAALLEGVEPNATGALYDGIEGAGAENMPDACGLTYDAAGPNWVHTQVGGAKSCNCDDKCKKCDGKCDGKCPKGSQCATQVGGEEQEEKYWHIKYGDDGSNYNTVVKSKEKPKGYGTARVEEITKDYYEELEKKEIIEGEDEDRWDIEDYF